MRKYVLTCDHCKKEIPGAWTTMRFMTGPLEKKEYDLCGSCADEFQKWITGGNVNGKAQGSTAEIDKAHVD